MKLYLVYIIELIIPILLVLLLNLIPESFSLDFSNQIRSLGLECYLDSLNVVIRIIFVIMPIYVLYMAFKEKYNRYIKKIFESVPDKFFQFVRAMLLKKIPNTEDCYSLFCGFNDIRIVDVSEKFEADYLSINGLVGELNQEDKGTDVSSSELKCFRTSILKKIDGVEYGDNHLLESQNALDKYKNIFSETEINKAIKEVKKNILDRENTFKFIADQFGIYDIKLEDRTLEIKVYKTNHFTFKVMNRLYSNNKLLLEDLAIKFCKSISKEEIRKEGFQIFFPFFASLGINIILELISQQRGKCFVIQKRSSRVYGNVSQYHISVNETFSFTDMDENKYPSIKACVLRGIEEELGVDLYCENSNNIKYLDLFFNPKRGNLGLSLVYKSKENPSYITYYPGIDKVVEADKHICVYDIRNYLQMKNFISLFNWIVYTPFLLKRYSIYNQSKFNCIKTSYSIDKGLFISIILYYVSFIVSLGMLVFFYFVKQHTIAGVLLIPIISILWAKFKQMYGAYKEEKQLREYNIDKVSVGAFPYGRNVILYTGTAQTKALEAKNIVLAIKESISIPINSLSIFLEKEYDYDFTDYLKSQSSISHNQNGEIKWDLIKINDIEAGVRHVSHNEEYPTLILKGHIVSNTGVVNNTSLYIKEFAINSENDEYCISYNIKGDELYFGYNREFNEIFEIETGCHLSKYAQDLLQKKGYSQLRELKTKSEWSGISLFDVYKYEKEGRNTIIISAQSRNSDSIFQETVKGKKDEISKELCSLIKKYKTDKNEILMLQQILIRKKIYLFEKSC